MKFLRMGRSRWRDHWHASVLLFEFCWLSVALTTLVGAVNDASPVAVLTTARSIPTSCFTRLPDSAEQVACRTVTFCATNVNYSFALFSDPSSLRNAEIYFSTFSMSALPTQVFSVDACGADAMPSRLFVSNSMQSVRPISSPFDVSTDFATLASRISLRSNGTCLSVVLPHLIVLTVFEGLVSPIGFDLTFPWLYNTSRYISRISEAQYVNLSAFSVCVTNAVSDDPLVALPIVSAASAVIGIAGMWTAFPSPYPETAMAIIFANNGCVQQNVRDASNAAQWSVLVFSDGVPLSTLVQALELQSIWRTFAVLLVLIGLHVVIVAVARVAVGKEEDKKCAAVPSSKYRRKDSSDLWQRARSRTGFPWISCGLLMACVPSLTFGALLSFRDASRGWSVVGPLPVCLGAAAFVVLIAASAAPWLLFRFTGVLQHRDTRYTHDALCVLPSLLRMVVPKVIWGPTHRLTEWYLPFCAATSNYAYWCVAPYVLLVVVASVTIPWPHSLSGCIVQEVFALVVVFVYCVLLARRTPFRGRGLNALALLHVAAFGFVLIANLARCSAILRESSPPDQAVQTLVILYHCIGVARGVIHLASALVEKVFVRPLVWPSNECFDLEEILFLDKDVLDLYPEVLLLEESDQCAQVLTPHQAALKDYVSTLPRNRAEFLAKRLPIVTTTNSDATESASDATVPLRNSSTKMELPLVDAQCDDDDVEEGFEVIAAWRNTQVALETEEQRRQSEAKKRQHHKRQRMEGFQNRTWAKEMRKASAVDVLRKQFIDKPSGGSEPCSGGSDAVGQSPPEGMLLSPVDEGGSHVIAPDGKTYDVGSGVLTAAELKAMPSVLLNRRFSVMDGEKDKEDRQARQALLDVAKDEAAKAQLKGPVERLLRGEGYVPWSLGRHRLLEIRDL